MTMIELGLEVEALEEPLYVSSPLRIKARIGMICRGCELEISGTLLTVDLRIMDMSEFDVILGMDWLTAYRIVIDCERRRVTARGANETRQLVSYSSSTRSKLGQNSTRVSSTRTRTRLEMLTSRVEQPVTRLEKLARNSKIFCI